MMDVIFKSVQAMAPFAFIRASSRLYLVLLALHVVSLAFFGGMILATELRLLGFGMQSYSVSEVLNGLRVPKRVGLALALTSGLLMFGAQAEQYSHNRWFWAKITLLVLIALNGMLFRQVSGRTGLAASISLLLWTGVIITGRGPSTIKDVMHSMVDPSGDFIFQSVQQVGDERGTHEIAPTTDAGWAEVRSYLAVLHDVPILVQGRRGARLRDRSKNPQSESEPEEIQAALDADPPSLLRRARKLQDAATLAMKAVDARDRNALLRAIDGIDKACENCHLHYWYPNDKRAQQAAREDGVTDF